MFDPMSALALGGLLGGKSPDVKVQTTTTASNVLSAPINVQFSSPGSPSVEAPIETPLKTLPTIYDEQKERGSWWPSIPTVPSYGDVDNPNVDSIQAGVLGGGSKWIFLLLALGVATYLIFVK